MKSIICSLMLVLSLVFASSFAGAAEDPPKKEVPPKKEIPKKEKKPETTIEWTELKVENSTGTLKKPAPNAKKVEPTSVEFEVEAKGFRIKIKAEAAGEEKGGSMKAVLLKKDGTGEKAKFRNAANLGSIRAGAEIGKVFPLGPGTYKIEMEGEKVKYEVTVETAEQKTADGTEKPKAEK